jgi:AraC family transcriptional regulator, exoenzyme S synthesis regulatory protein ExsA
MVMIVCLSELILSDFDDEFCSLFMFVPDYFIKETVIGNQLETASKDHSRSPAPILRVQINEILQSYFLSLLSYISNKGQPDATDQAI